MSENNKNYILDVYNHIWGNKQGNYGVYMELPIRFDQEIKIKKMEEIDIVKTSDDILELLEPRDIIITDEYLSFFVVGNDVRRRKFYAFDNIEINYEQVLEFLKQYSESTYSRFLTSKHIRNTKETL